MDVIPLVQERVSSTNQPLLVVTRVKTVGGGRMIELVMPLRFSWDSVTSHLGVV